MKRLIKALALLLALTMLAACANYSADDGWTPTLDAENECYQKSKELLPNGAIIHDFIVESQELDDSVNMDGYTVLQEGTPDLLVRCGTDDVSETLDGNNCYIDFLYNNKDGYIVAYQFHWKEGYGESGESSEENAEDVQIANPWTNHDSLEDAIAAVGFDFRIPDTIADLPPSAFRTMDGILEVIYETPEDAESPYLCITLRKGANETDISGDYNTYKQVQQGSKSISTAESVKYIIRGNGDVYSAADWVQDGHFYSVLITGAETLLPEDAEELPAWWIIETIADNLIALNNQ